MATSTALAQQLAGLDQSWDPTAAYNQATQALGIPDARTRVQGLQTAIANSENAIKAVDPSVTGRTQGSLVTEAQRQRLVNMEQAPLTDQYNTQTKNYNTENTNLNQLMDQAQQQYSLQESAYKTKRQSLADQITFAQQQEEIARQQAAARTTSTGSSRSSGGSSRSSGSSKVAASLPSKQQIYGAIGGALAAVRGPDGYVSPQSYAKAKADFVKAGYSASTFDNEWQNLRNPKNKNYKLG